MLTWPLAHTFSAHVIPCSRVLCSHILCSCGRLLRHSLLRAPCSRVLCSSGPLLMHSLLMWPLAHTFSAHMAPCSHVLCSRDPLLTRSLLMWPPAHMFSAQGPFLTRSLLRAPCSRLLCSHSPLISCWFHLHLISEPLTAGSKPSQITWGSTIFPQQVGGESPQTSGMTTELPKSLMYSMLVHSPCTQSMYE